VDVHDETWLAAQGFGGVLAVGAGSRSPPRLIQAAWRPRNSGSTHLVIIGKGITFDSGGLNLKPGDSMRTMYTDMAGAAAALGALQAVAASRLPVRLTVLVPAAENSPSGSAMRPSDVIRHYGGRTTEVQNTDAEGRLVLADALAYAAAFVMNVVLCVALVPQFGGHGAAAATSLSLLLETVLLFHIARHRLGLHMLAFGKPR